MIKIAAINIQSEESGSEEEFYKETLEQIALQEYARALDLQRKGNVGEATQLLKDLLSTELLSDVQKSKSKDEQVSRPLFNLKYLCYKNLASMLQSVGELDAAIEAFSAASELDDTDITLWHRLGEVSMQAKNYEMALYAFQRGVERNPRHWPCLDKMITLLLGLKYKEHCIAAIHDALQLDPGYMRGLAYRRHIYTVYRHMREYMAYINPIYTWNEADDEPIDECVAEKLIKEAEDIQEISAQQQKAEQIKTTIPKLKLEKPIKKYTWKSVGDSLVHMHKYITENGFSHASHIEIVIAKEEECEEKNEPEKQSSTESEKASVRRRGSAVTALETWVWYNRRKSGRKKLDYQETLYDSLYKLVPLDLTLESPQNKKQIEETSLDAANLEMFFDEKANETENEQYFGKTLEEDDVKIFLDKCTEKTRDIIDLLSDYLSVLSKKYKLKWPEGLSDVFVEANDCYNTHIDIPACTDDNHDNLVHFVSVNLLAQELTVNEKLNSTSDKEPIHELNTVQSIELIVTQKPDIFSGSECLEMVIRSLWLKVHIHNVNKCDDFMLESLYQLLEEFNAMGEHHNTYCLNLVNFTYKPNIQESVILKNINSLQRNTKLSVVKDLYNQNKYDELLTILMEYFEQCKEVAAKQEEKMSLDFATQVCLIIESYWALNKVDSCLKWAFVCLHESLEIYHITMSVAKENEKWSRAINKILCCIEHILETEGISSLDIVSRSELSQGINDLIRIASHQIETSANNLPFDTIAPWIILHYILQREEDEKKNKKIEGSDKSIVNKNTVACDEVPIPLQILFTAHEELGEKTWCCHSEGKLLYFILDNVVPRLRSPILAKSLQQINRCLEQCVFCLYGHRAKKAKSKVIDHKATSFTLDWKRAQQIYEIFRPSDMPALTGNVSAITNDTETLFQRILALLPTEYDLAKYVTETEKYINCVEDRLPSVPPMLPYKMRDIYFFLGDYHFKNENNELAIKYNVMDVVINNDRFLSWAEIALAKAAIIDNALKLYKNIDGDSDFLNTAKSTMRCFKKSVNLNPKVSYLWVEYGTFVYRVHSFCSRLLKQASESLSMEEFKTLEKHKEECLRITKNCLTVVERLNSSSDSDKSDNWLLYYTLGKVAEKRHEAPSVYITFYMQGVKSLQEAGAIYPTKISYNTPPYLSIEVLELQYRIHASILKYIEQHENNRIPASVGKVFIRCLEEWQQGPFKKKIKKYNDISENNPVSNVHSSLQAANKLKRSASDASEEDNPEAKRLKSEIPGKVKRLASYDGESLSRKDSIMTSAVDIKDTNESEHVVVEPKPDTSISNEHTNKTMDCSEEKQKETISEGNCVNNDKQDESSRSSSSSSSSGSSDTSSDRSSDSNANSDSSSDSTEDTTEEQIDKIVSDCLDALEDCASRYTPHYKALYRLAHYHFYSKKGKNIEKCRDLMLSTFISRSGQKMSGLFSVRRTNNFFNNIWRFSSTDVEKPGGFAAHMNRSVLLTLEILKEIDDHKTLLELSLHLQKTPEKDKKYLRDSDREDLAQQAFSLSLQSLKGQVFRFSQQADLKSNEVERQALKSLMFDIYKAYGKVQKQSNSKQLINLLVDAYKLIITTPVTDKMNLVDLSMKYSQSLKQQATQVAIMDKSQTLPKKQNVNKSFETSKPVTAPPVQTKSDPPPQTTSSSVLPKLPSHELSFQDYLPSFLNDPLLAQQAGAALYNWPQLSALANYASLQTLQSTMQSSYQNSFQAEIYRQYLENYAPYSGMMQQKKKRGPKPMKRSLSSGVQSSVPATMKPYPMPSTTKAAPTPVITSFQKTKSTPSMGTVLSSLPPSMTASLSSFGSSSKHSNALAFAPQAHMPSSSLVSSSSKSTVSHKQVSPAKTLQEKLLAERYKGLPTSKSIPQEINASISRLPSSLTITKTSAAKQPLVQGRKPEAKSDVRPNPISSDVVIVLDDD